MFDSICKFLAETFSADFAAWLLGEPIALTELSPSELSVEPIRADALILLQSDNILLHIEFQTQPKVDIPFRMADYRLRAYRRFPQRRMHQAVIYLKQSRSSLVQQTTFTLERTQHEFDVIRLWEQLTSLFLQSPGLLPFATLSQTANSAATLQEVAEAIDQLDDRQVQSNVAATAAVLAGLVLERNIIQKILRRDLMRESVIYQSILLEGREAGREEGREAGREEGREAGRQAEVDLILRLLNRRIGSVPVEVQQQVRSLSVSELAALGEALLDFAAAEDLVNWLQNRS